jgi:Fic family protein
MDPSDFKSNASGEVRRMPSGYYAFIPKAPPSRFDDAEVLIPLSIADAALGELSGLGRYLPNPHLLIRPYLRREATASTRIEGTQADLNDLFVDEVSPTTTATTSDVAEIRNYVRALELGRSKMAELPFAGRLVREIHSTLLSDVRGQERRPGEFRISQNWIGGRGPADAHFVPPPPEELWKCFGDWENFVNTRDAMPVLIQCALMHAHLETIHPFLDGNGRIGRLLMTLFLIERGRLSEPLLYVSSYIEKHKAEYYDALQRTRTHADWLGWVRYFLEAVGQSARSAIADAKRLLELRSELRSHAGLTGKHREQHLVDELFTNPYITVQRARMALAVSDMTAKKSIDHLVAIGMLKEITGKNWGRVWVALPIRDALQGTAL